MIRAPVETARMTSGCAELPAEELAATAISKINVRAASVTKRAETAVARRGFIPTRRMGCQLKLRR